MSEVAARLDDALHCFHCEDTMLEVEAVVAEVAGERRVFCCQGCHAAAELIHGLGLDAYYAQRDAPVIGARAATRTDPRALERFDDPVVQKRFVSWDDEGLCTASLTIGGMRCAACSWLIEERLARFDGIAVAHAGLADGRARVTWDPAKCELSEILGAVARLGYRALPFEPDREEALLRAERRAALRRLGVSGLASMQVMMFSLALYLGAFGDLEAEHRQLLHWASALVATPVLAYAGWPFLSAAFRDLRFRRVGPDVPITLALLVAYGASLYAMARGEGDVYFDSVCMFIFFISLGRFVERDLRSRAELRVRQLVGRVPRVARRLRGEGDEDVPVDDLASGDLVEVEAGAWVPADGVAISSRSAVSEALLTGEPTPIEKTPGDAVLAGSEVLEGTLRLRVERTGAASTVQQIAGLLDRAHLEKPPIAVMASRVARRFVTAVLLIAAAVALAWSFVDPSQVVPVVVSVLIATCPCALSLATPSALAAATHGLAERGFLITRGHVLEGLTRIRRVLLDKTGTLTAETPTLAAVRVVRDGVCERDALRWARALEQGSNHPIARALRSRVGGHGAEATDSSSPLQVLPSRHQVEVGAGVTGEVEGRNLRIGRADWAGASRTRLPGAEPGAAPTTSVVLCDERGALAWFDLETTVRAGAPTMVRTLSALGLQPAIVSGDPSSEAVETIAHALGIEDATAEASPEQKLARIDAMEGEGQPVLAVGDGLNDAPLLARASVSIAMGSGSDLARLRADAVLLDDRLESIPLAIAWARRTQRVIRQNFAWALLYNASVLPLAAAGVLAPWQAALGMSLSSLIVVGNSLRLRRPANPRPGSEPTE